MTEKNEPKNGFNRMLWYGHRMLIFVTEEVSLFWFFVVFVGVVMAFAGLYLLLTPSGEGLGTQGHALDSTSFKVALYFSIVTVTTLGYGDYQPFGFSRALSCLEVLLGLVFVGISIAKITSRRLSHHVARLFAADAQRRLDDHASLFTRLEGQILGALKALGNAYQTTPSGPPVSTQVEASALFRAVLFEFRSACVSLAAYFGTELRQGDYFSVIPKEPVHRLAGIVDRTLFALGQLIIPLPPDARMAVLDNQNRQLIAEALDSLKETGDLVTKHSKDEALRNQFGRIAETCNGLPTNYFAPTPPAGDQPDQVVEKVP